jgi:hypothetical protein
MKRIRVYVTTNRVGSKVERIFEVEDDCSEQEIEEFAKDSMFEMIEWGYSEVES